MIRIVAVFFSLLGSVVVLGLHKGAEARPKVATYKLLYAFQLGTDGNQPLASLLNVGGTLYGTTFSGGTSVNCNGGCGTVFSYNLKTGVYQTVYSFVGENDGWGPSSNLINVGGSLYGTTDYGGGSANCSSSGCGTVFSIDLKTGKENVVYSFRSQNDGATPLAGLVYVDGKLYGTTAYGGGALGAGTVFSVDPANGSETVVHAFQGEPYDGYYPLASLINVGGILYGTTDGGGTYDNGTVFSFNPNNNVEKLLHSFGDTPTKHGFGPYASVVDVNGLLFGTTYAGGAHGFGTIFSVNPTTGAEKVVYSFAAKGKGAEPESGLTILGSQFYGTTYPDPSIVFSLNPATGAEKVVYPNVGNQAAGLISVGATLYGTTNDGGDPSCGCGTIFALTP